ncbi:MAG: hypothetical protein U0235_15295 [Polyangiaceae bacterium]
MSTSVVLVTGANGEIGRALLPRLRQGNRYRIVTVDLTPLPETYRQYCDETYAGNILDRYLLDQGRGAPRDRGRPPLGRALSSSGERDPGVGTRSTSRARCTSSAWPGHRRPARCAHVLLSSIATCGLPSVEEKKKVGKIREEHLEHADHDVRLQQALPRAPRPPLHAASSVRWAASTARGSTSGPSASRPHLRRDGTWRTSSDFGPEMLHSARGEPYKCFVGPDAHPVHDDARRVDYLRCCSTSSTAGNAQRRRLQRVRGGDRGAREEELPERRHHLRAGRRARAHRRPGLEDVDDHRAARD